MPDPVTRLNAALEGRYRVLVFAGAAEVGGGVILFNHLVENWFEELKQAVSVD